MSNKQVPIEDGQSTRVEGPVNDSAKSSGPDISAFEFEGWAILELMGHRKLGGYVRMNGPLIRIDVHDEEKAIATQWYGAHSLYCLSPCSETVTKRLTRSYRPEPVTAFELSLPAPAPRNEEDDPDFNEVPE